MRTKEVKITQRKQQSAPIQQPKDFPFILFDTEDDSKECMAEGSGKTGFDKQVTQIAAITAGGARWYWCKSKESSEAQGVKSFKAWLLRRPEKFVYSHNIKYDLGAMFADELDELDQTLVGGRVIKAVWGKKTFVDVFNMWPMSVKKLGKAFGIEKLDTDDMAGDKAYVFRDVEIIRAAMLFTWDYCEQLGLEYLPATLGGLGVALWKHWGGVAPHDSTAMVRAAMFGGRVELFKRRNESEHVCYTDINSLYPSVMRGDFPGPMVEWKEKRLPRFGVMTATVSVPKMELCPLPFRKDDGMILYPWGKFTGTWTLVELRNAVRLGARIVKRHDCWGTNEACQPYKDYVDRLYLARQRCKSEAERTFFKLLMNTRYGRLGTQGKIGRTVWQTKENRNKGVPFGEKVLITYQMPLSEETNWAHAAYVTAYGRIALLDFMLTIGADKMIYCDTDSCIFDSPGKTIPFAVGAELGQMKLEAWETRCETYAPKMYNIGKTWKAKGVPVRLAQEFIENGHVEYDLPFNMREAIAFFDRGNIKKLAVWRRVTKDRKTTYTRKSLHGNRYLPCKVNAV